MAKEVQMSVKMEPELRDEFMEAAARVHKPAAQLVREFMREFIANSKLSLPIPSGRNSNNQQDHVREARDAA